MGDKAIKRKCRHTIKVCVELKSWGVEIRYCSNTNTLGASSIDIS